MECLPKGKKLGVLSNGSFQRALWNTVNSLWTPPFPRPPPWSSSCPPQLEVLRTPSVIPLSVTFAWSFKNSPLLLAAFFPPISCLFLVKRTHGLCVSVGWPLHPSCSDRCLERVVLTLQCLLPPLPFPLLRYSQICCLFSSACCRCLG